MDSLVGRRQTIGTGVFSAEAVAAGSAGPFAAPLTQNSRPGDRAEGDGISRGSGLYRMAHRRKRGKSLSKCSDICIKRKISNNKSTATPGPDAEAQRRI